MLKRNVTEIKVAEVSENNEVAEVAKTFGIPGLTIIMCFIKRQ